jgi:hypothetical protein
MGLFEELEGMTPSAKKKKTPRRKSTLRDRATSSRKEITSLREGMKMQTDRAHGERGLRSMNRAGAIHSQSTGIRPAPLSKAELQHGERARAVHRNVIKATGQGVNVAPEQMNKRMRAGEGAPARAAAGRHATKVDDLKFKSQTALGSLRKEVKSLQAAAEQTYIKRAPSAAILADPELLNPTEVTTKRFWDKESKVPKGEMKHANKAQQVHRGVIKAANKGIAVPPANMAKRLAKKAARKLPVIGAAIGAYDVLTRLKGKKNGKR